MKNYKIGDMLTRKESYYSLDHHTERICEITEDFYILDLRGKVNKKTMKFDNDSPDAEPFIPYEDTKAILWFDQNKNSLSTEQINKIYNLLK